MRIRERRAHERAAVEEDAVVRLVGEQEDRPAVPLGRAPQSTRRERPVPLGCRCGPSDSAGELTMIGARLRRDGRLDGAGVEPECGPRQRDADRRRAHDRNHRLVEEPRRRDEDDFVAGIDGRAQRDGEGRKRPGREIDIRWLEVEARPRAERIRQLRWRRPESSWCTRTIPCSPGRHAAGSTRRCPCSGISCGLPNTKSQIVGIANALRVLGVVQEVEKRAQGPLWIAARRVETVDMSGRLRMPAER